MTSPTPTSDLTSLLTGAGVPDAFVPAAAAHLGEKAADRLRADPWELLLVPAVRPEQADHFARQVLGAAASPADPRRGRALVAHLLGVAARQGHTALPAKAVADRLTDLGVPDPVKAVTDALDEARVLAVTDEDESFDADDSEPEQLLALARYAMAEDAVAEGLMRLSATAEDSGVTVLSGPGCVEAALTLATDSATAGLRTVIATSTTRRATELSATLTLPLATPAPAPTLDPPPTITPTPHDVTAGRSSGGTTPADGDAPRTHEAAGTTSAPRSDGTNGTGATADHPGGTIPATDHAPGTPGSTGTDRISTTGHPGGAPRTHDAVGTTSTPLSRGTGLADDATAGRSSGTTPAGGDAPRTQEAVGGAGLHPSGGGEGGDAAARSSDADSSGRGEAAGAEGVDAAAAVSGAGGSGDEGWRGVRVMSLGRLLEAVPAPGGLAFGRGEQRAVAAEVVVVPDAGALDVELAAALVEACADGTRLVLAGDQVELPSAGPGRVFGDVVAAGVLPVRRTQTRGPDHETPIEQLLGGIREGEFEPVEAPGREVVMVPAASAAEAVHRVVQLVTDSIPRALGIPAEDVQVVAPAAAGEAGTAALNAALKERLNPGPGKYRGFDPGDRVVVVAPLPGVAVGETGTVRDVEGAELVVDFPGGPAGISPGLVARLRPGWAVTVQQALGTRWPGVVAVFPEGVALTRPLVASALARAVRHVSVVHAAGPELARAVRDVPGPVRRTRLTGLLRTM